MDVLNCFDVAEFNGFSMVVVGSDLLPRDASFVVIPLLSDYLAVRHLNPEITNNGKRLILATRLIAAVQRSRLTRTGRVAYQSELITRAVDALMAGAERKTMTFGTLDR